MRAVKGVQLATLQLSQLKQVHATSPPKHAGVQLHEEPASLQYLSINTKLLDLHLYKHAPVRQRANRSDPHHAPLHPTRLTLKHRHLAETQDSDSFAPLRRAFIRPPRPGPRNPRNKSCELLAARRVRQQRAIAGALVCDLPELRRMGGAVWCFRVFLLELTRHFVLTLVFLLHFRVPSFR